MLDLEDAVKARRHGDRRGAGARRESAELVTNSTVAHMKPGAVLVDIAIDQGGCFEDSRPTTHDDPTFAVHDTPVLLRGQHAGRSAAHVDVRADQCHYALVSKLADKGWHGRRASRIRRWPRVSPRTRAPCCPTRWPSTSVSPTPIPLSFWPDPAGGYMSSTLTMPS